MNTSTFLTNKALLISTIEQTIYYGGSGNFVKINLGDYYLQLAAARGDYDISCEAVSNNYLGEEIALSATQIEELIQLSWTPPTGPEGNFSLSHKVDSESARTILAKLLLTTAKQVYNYPTIEPNNIDLNLE